MCVTLLVCTIVMQATPIIQNGMFTPNSAYSPKVTTGYYPGGAKDIFVNPWYFSGATNTHNGSGVVGWNTGIWDYVPMNGAQYNAFLQGKSYISQTISLVKGDVYTLTFWLSARPGYAVDPVEVLLGGTMQTVSTTNKTTTGIVSGGTQLGGTISVAPVDADKIAVWTKYTESFKATTTGPELLTFAGMTPSTCGTDKSSCDFNAGLDNVSAAMAPEPAMALLLPLGLLFVNGLRKRFLA